MQKFWRARHIFDFLCKLDFMISDHVESNMTPISDFTNCNANHCPYSKLHDFGPCKIEYFVMTPRVLPTPVPTCAPFRFYQLQCQPAGRGRRQWRRRGGVGSGAGRAAAMAARRGRLRWQRRGKGGGDGGGAESVDATLSLHESSS